MKEIIRRAVPRRLHPLALVRRHAERASAGRVLSGPFRGMALPPVASMGSVSLPKRLGTYELELHSVVERIVAGGCKEIVNIGAGEGYYTVGLALRLPGARITAFESDAGNRAALQEIARLNGVAERIRVSGTCSHEELRRALGPGTGIVICDIEGGEDDLLDPARVPELGTRHLLVEIHEFVRRGVADRLAGRFSGSHDVETIWQQDRTVDDFPCRTAYQRLLPAKYTLAHMSELRPERMSWLWLTPRRPHARPLSAADECASRR